MNVIPQSGKQLDKEKGLRLLRDTRAIGWDRFCEGHLRRLAGGGIGLCTNKKRRVLLRRLRVVWDWQKDLQGLKLQRARYFRQAVNQENAAGHGLGPVRWTVLPVAMFDFDAKEVFNRFAGDPQAWDVWVQDGTINVRGMFRYLVEGEIGKLVLEEFNMYKYHCRKKVHGKGRMGWLRNMIHSLVQQVIRQDPGFYGIMAAARPDRNWRLISYPYYTKDTSPGERTGFMHFDIGVGRLVDAGDGKNLVQSAVSLDDEDEENCSVVLPGLHHQLGEWYSWVRERGQETCGYTTNAAKIYMAADQEEFGRLVEVPCQAGDIRISQPGIMHGSSKRATRRRRVVFAWHSGIRSDHSTLDLEESETWEEVSGFHRDLSTPRKSTSGEGFRYGRAGESFGGAVKLGHTSAIGDALVGGRRWTEGQVLAERAVVLGADGSAALQYVSSVRDRLVKQFHQQFSTMMAAEMSRYGRYSYFRGGTVSSSSSDSSSGVEEEREFAKESA